MTFFEMMTSWTREIHAMLRELESACRRYGVPTMFCSGSCTNWDLDWLVEAVETQERNPWKLAEMLRELICTRTREEPTTDAQLRRKQRIREQRHNHCIDLLRFWLELTWATSLGLTPTVQRCSDLAWRRVAGKGGWLHHRTHDVFDHDRTFKTTGRLRATDTFIIASNPYGDRKKEAAAFAERTGCSIEYPDFPSWWFPGFTTLITFTNRRKAPPLARYRRTSISIAR
jgi:hypothetical protein